MNSIFDSGMNGLPRSEMYRAWVVPELFPKEQQPRLENWSDDDLEAYCGVYR